MRLGLQLQNKQAHTHTRNYSRGLAYSRGTRYFGDPIKRERVAWAGVIELGRQLGAASRLRRIESTLTSSLIQIRVFILIHLVVLPRLISSYTRETQFESWPLISDVYWKLCASSLLKFHSQSILPAQPSYFKEIVSPAKGYGSSLDNLFVNQLYCKIQRIKKCVSNRINICTFFSLSLYCHNNSKSYKTCRWLTNAS